MSDRVTITEASLRDAVRDPRYWTPGHPEREALGEWVSGGFRALYNSGNAEGGAVEVRAYTRQRDGRTEHVGAHTRGAPPGGGMATPAMGPAIRGARKIAPMIPPVIGDIIGALPVPDWLRRTPAVPRPSLLEPPEERGAPPGTSGGAMQSVLPDGGEEESNGEIGPGSGGAHGDDTFGGPTLRPSPETVEELVGRLPPLGQNSKGTPNLDGGGNEDQLDSDARALHPGAMTEIGPGRRIGTLPDGRRIMVRPSSERSDGEPTIEISKPAGVNAAGRPRFEREYEIRYRPGRTGR